MVSWSPMLQASAFGNQFVDHNDFSPFGAQGMPFDHGGDQVSQLQPPPGRRQDPRRRKEDGCVAEADGANIGNPGKPADILDGVVFQAAAMVE